jgi:hypothetical protein
MQLARGDIVYRANCITGKMSAVETASSSSRHLPHQVTGQSSIKVRNFPFERDKSIAELMV